MKLGRTLAIVAAGQVAYRIHKNGWRLVEHDLIDHPLMTLWPRVGDWLHDRDVAAAPSTRSAADLFAELRVMAADGRIYLPNDDETILDELQAYLKAPNRRCHVCGCTDTIACAGGCTWVYSDPDVCSSCVIPGTWGADYFARPAADWVEALSIGERLAAEQTLRIKAHRSNGVPLPPDLR